MRRIERMTCIAIVKAAVVGLGVMAFLFGPGFPRSAEADSIGVSINSVRSFFFTGVDFEGPNPNSSATDSATYTGFPAASNSASCPPAGPGCNPGGLAANPPQATSGPGPFPPQDTYTQPPAGGFTGSRGDANVTSISFGQFGGGAQNVAETRATGNASGTAAGTNHLSTTLTLTGPTNPRSLGFSFLADPFLQVGVTSATGESASATISMIVTLLSGQTTVFRWTPGVTAGEIGVASETDPFSLNRTITATSPAGNMTVNPAEALFSATTGLLGNGDYIINIDLSESVSATSVGAAAVPEPATLLLLGAGLVALAGGTGWNKHRRN
jgi:hypothetical protein